MSIVKKTKNKKLQQIYLKKTNNPREKWAKNINKQLTEGIQMANKHVFKKMFNLLLIGKLQIQKTSYNFSCSRPANIKKMDSTIMAASVECVLCDDIFLHALFFYNPHLTCGLISNLHFTGNISTFLK